VHTKESLKLQLDDTLTTIHGLLKAKQLHRVEQLFKAGLHDERDWLRFVMANTSNPRVVSLVVAASHVLDKLDKIAADRAYRDKYGCHLKLVHTESPGILQMRRNILEARKRETRLAQSRADRIKGGRGHG
jgi:hypothetical protein